MSTDQPPHTMRRQPARIMRVAGFDYDHEVQIALPKSYHHTDEGHTDEGHTDEGHTDASFPVLWVTDGSVFFDLAAAIAATCKIEMIIVGIGCPRDEPGSEFGRRRTNDFSPSSYGTYDGLGGRLLDAHAGRGEGVDIRLGLRMEPDAGAAARLAEVDRPAGGAPKFLDFLIDELRPTLAAEYRMDEDDHCLFGVSGGGMFVGYSIFARPGAFAKYICGSPVLNGGNYMVFDMEEKYAANHEDFPVSIFFGAGEEELDHLGHSAWDICGSMTRMAQTLRLRQYSSLRVTTRFFPGEGHNSVIPFTMSHGIRWLWELPTA